MVNWIEKNRYESSWGAWYVQIELDGQVVELKFKHSPTSAEIDPIAQQVWASMQPPESTILLGAEDETEV